jgi:hypothetical protein
MVQALAVYVQCRAQQRSAEVVKLFSKVGACTYKSLGLGIVPVSMRSNVDIRLSVDKMTTLSDPF